MRITKIHRLTTLSAFVLVTLLVLSASVLADEQPRTLGGDGTIYQLVNSTYRALFDDDDSVPGVNANNGVLALDLMRPDGSSSRLLVPGTEDFYSEDFETLVYEDTSGVIYVLWEGFQYGIHPKIYLTGFDGQKWRDVIEIGASPFGRKSSPQLVVTQDKFEDQDSALGWRDRTILNVTWWEQKHYGSAKVFAPLVLEDGEYVGQTDVVNLSALSGGGGDFPAVSSGIANALSLQPGHNVQSNVVGYVEPASGDLVVLSLEVLPAALLDLAEKARLQIINLGAKDDLEEVAQAAYNSILDLETNFHFTSLLWFAESIRDMILSTGLAPTQAAVELLAEKARLQIINLGASLKAHGLEGPQSSQILSVRGADPDALGHFIDVREVLRLPAPDVGSEAKLFLSATGERVLVAWEEQGRIYYVESAPEIWSELHFISLSDQIDSQDAYRILELRIRK
jgi:hypothetical protein